MVLDTPLLVKLIFFSTLILLLPTVIVATVSHKHGSSSWAYGLALLACGCWLSLQQNVLSDLYSMVVSMALISAGMFFFLRGVKHLFGRQNYLWYLLVPVILMLLSQWLLSYSYQFRAIGSSFILGAQFLLLVVAVLTDRVSPLCKLRMLLLFAALIPGVVYLLRGVVYLMTSDMPYFALGNSPLQIIALLSVLGFLPLATVAVLLMRQSENQTSSSS